MSKDLLELLKKNPWLKVKRVMGIDVICLDDMNRSSNNFHFGKLYQKCRAAGIYYAIKNRLDIDEFTSYYKIISGGLKSYHLRVLSEVEFNAVIKKAREDKINSIL
jgi:hypothetical protein